MAAQEASRFVSSFCETEIKDRLASSAAPRSSRKLSMCSVTRSA